MADDNNNERLNNTRKAELAALVLIVMFSALLVIRQMVHPIPTPILFILSGGAVSGLFSLHRKRQGRPFSVWVGIFIFCMFLGNVYSLFRFGGLESPVTLFICAMPVAGAIFVSRQFGFFLLAASSAVLALLCYLHLSGHSFDATPFTGPAGTIVTAVYSVIVAFALIMVVIFDQSRRTGETRHERIKAETDFLTGLLNRAGFENAFNRKRLSPRQNGALLAIDIDHFKECNDTRGHDAGDRCLQDIANALAACLQRDDDLIGRVGGDEFMVLLADTDEDGAIAAAHRMRKAVSDLHIFTDEEVPRKITITIGVACYNRETDSCLDALYKIVDRALYIGKNDGKDCVKTSLPNVVRLQTA